MTVNKRIFYLVIALAAVILVVELTWAYATLYKPAGKKTAPASATSLKSTGQISLIAPKSDLKVGEQMSIAIRVSATVPTDGTDIVLNYDPKLVEVVATGSKSAVTVTAIYSQYPGNSLDAAKGVIAVSGISNEKNGVLTDGVFGTIVLRAKAVGSTTMNVVYSPGATNESNVIETATGKDILENAQNLQLVITK